MKVVIDTNVIVSGLLSPHGAPAEVVRMLLAGSIELCADARILSEYEEVLSRPKFGFDAEQVGLVMDYISHAANMVAAGPLPERLPDPDDEPFAEVACAASPSCLITGNIRHYPAKMLRNVKVLSPEDFIEYYRKK